MSGLILTQSETFILGPIAKLLGYIMEGIFQFLKLLIAIINKIAHIAAMVLKYHFGGINMPFLWIIANPNILDIFIAVALLL